MKPKHFFLAFCFLWAAAGCAFADLAEPQPESEYERQARLERRIELVNDQEFEGYVFYLTVPEQEEYLGEFASREMRHGEMAYVGRFGEQYCLTAVKGDLKFRSELADFDDLQRYPENARYRLERLKILSIENGKIQFEVVSRETRDEEDKVIETPSKGSVAGLGVLQTVILPMACLLGLLLFFVFRRRVDHPSSHVSKS
jgi:hypothetical protein